MSLSVFISFFFFKQKTAYEMRISDWSSDVCSSDLGPLQARLDLDAELERVSAFLPMDGGRLGGQAALHVTVTGTPADPVVGGTGGVRDGLVEQPVKIGRAHV